ncbi:MAG: 2-aminoethylphosphonate--pyruvate transaminase [Thermoplasmata archaeon]|nr:2-aminoethylphosphonate--pyruvate transaminase [Thermoplasmata archaeon]
MIAQAVIMAGGLGSRLGSRTKDMPKGFLEVGGKPIIVQSIEKLIAAGVEEIIIGTGYHAEWYQELAGRYPCIRLAHNADYASTGSMATLAACAPLVKGDFLLLESDLLYDSIGLHVLINDPRRDVILSSGRTGSGDEVWLQVDSQGSLVRQSKHADQLDSVYSELVGITKLRKETLDLMAEEIRRQGNPKMEYEAAMQAVSCAGNGIAVRKVEYYTWCEIDDESHLKRAVEQVYPRIAENEDIRGIRREVLLNPGPATTTDSVKYAQVQADICPRENEFGDVMGWISGELSLMVGEPGRVETVLFGGSGTAADEAMISSCVPQDGKLLIVDNGAYGKRMAKMAGIYGIDYATFKSDGVSRIDVPALEKELVDGKFTHMAIVYHETTTGILNPVPEVCRFCREHGIVTIVDAVSAFAAIPIDMDRDCIDFMSSTSNKNIQGMAGLAFVFCRKEALEAIKDYPMRNYYLNVYDQHKYYKDKNQMRFTPPVQTAYALRQAILETKIETIEGRYARYTACWEVLVAAAKRIGLRMAVPESEQSHLIVTFMDPESPRYSFDEMHDLSREYGFTIYPGKLSDAKTFRIANIGDIRPEEMERFTVLLGQYMKTLRGDRVDADGFRRKLQEPDIRFYIVYTALYLFVIGLSDVMNGVVGNNYAWYDVYFYWEHARDIMDGLMPYQDFDTAYPPFSFVIYLIPYFFLSSETGFHYSFAMFTYLFTIIAIHFTFKFCDRRGVDHKYVYITFLLLILGLNNFLIARNDTITTVFVLLCILFYSERKFAVAFVLLALGIMTKIYPIFLLPVLLIPFFAQRDWKHFFLFGIVCAGVCFVIELPFLIADPSTAFSYLTQHSGRGVEIESLFAVPLMIIGLIDPSLVYVGMDESWDLFGPVAEGVAPYIMPLTFGIMLLFMLHFLVKMWKLRPDWERTFALTVLACAITLMLFMAFNKVFCAQYVMWVAILYPLMVWACTKLGVDRGRMLHYIVFLCAASLLTVLCMQDATDHISVVYILADALKGVATIILLWHLLKIYRAGLAGCASANA